MAFPDRIERTVQVAHPPQKVWAALTTAEGLSAWFGNEATIDLRPGGAAWMRWNEEGFTAEMRVERVEEPTVFGFTWGIYGLPADDPRRTTATPRAGRRNWASWSPTSMPDDIEAIAGQVFAALADPTRRAILAALARDWVSALGALTDHLDRGA